MKSGDALRAIRSGGLAILLAAGLDAALAHGGLSIDKDMCKLRVGPYVMHFVGYQPGVSGAKEFCEDIPLTGATTVVMDALDGVLREMPIEVRIVRDTGDGRELESAPVLHIPPRLYPGGSVSFDHNFERPGRFVGYVRAGDQGQHVARFPFSVGEGSGNGSFYLAFAGLAAAAAGLYVYIARAGRRRAAAARRLAD